MRSQRPLLGIHCPLFYFVVSLTLFLGGSAAAQPGRCDALTSLIQRHAQWDPDEFILEKLQTNRIVMLADAGHGDPLYTRTVTGALAAWLSRWEGGRAQALPSQLFLALEMDSLQIEAVKSFCRNGDRRLILHPMQFLGPQFTTGSLEFYQDLRELTLRLNAFNRTHPDGPRLELELFGPEKIIPLTGWTVEKRRNFFFYERDEFSSASVRALLEAHPKAKALIFYGAAHLARTEVYKEDDGARARGYYLAHYLTESFGRAGGVYVCGQVDVAARPGLDDGVKKVGKTFALDHAILQGIPIQSNSFFPFEDGAIYYVTRPRWARSIGDVLSRSLVDCLLDSLGMYTDTTGQFHRSIVMAGLCYLCNAAAVPLYPRMPDNVDSTLQAWNAWRRETNPNIVRDLATLQYFKRSVERVRSGGPLSAHHEYQLAQLTGFKSWFHSGAPPEVRADSLWSQIQRFRKDVIVQSLVPVLWFGSPGECEEAVTALRKETGLMLTTAKEWTRWLESGPVN